MPKIKISATRIKSWFQYRCERKFIYSAIIPRNTEDSKQKVQHKYSFIEKKTKIKIGLGQMQEMSLRTISL